MKKYDTHEYKIFICFTKECEHWGFHFKNENTVVSTFKKFTNIKLIWDSPFYATKTLIFSPKITLHSYFNNEKSRIEAFYWGRNAFDEITKEYGIFGLLPHSTDKTKLMLVTQELGLFWMNARNGKLEEIKTLKEKLKLEKEFLKKEKENLVVDINGDIVVDRQVYRKENIKTLQEQIKKLDTEVKESQVKLEKDFIAKGEKEVIADITPERATVMAEAIVKFLEHSYKTFI